MFFNECKRAIKSLNYAILNVANVRHFYRNIYRHNLIERCFNWNRVRWIWPTSLDVIFTCSIVVQTSTGLVVCNLNCFFFSIVLFIYLKLNMLSCENGRAKMFCKTYVVCYLFLLICDVNSTVKSLLKLVISCFI